MLCRRRLRNGLSSAKLCGEPLPGSLQMVLRVAETGDEREATLLLCYDRRLRVCLRGPVGTLAQSRGRTYRNVHQILLFHNPYDHVAHNRYTANQNQSIFMRVFPSSGLMGRKSDRQFPESVYPPTSGTQFAHKIRNKCCSNFRIADQPGTAPFADTSSSPRDSLERVRLLRG